MNVREALLVIHYALATACALHVGYDRSRRVAELPLRLAVTLRFMNAVPGDFDCGHLLACTATITIHLSIECRGLLCADVRSLALVLPPGFSPLHPRHSGRSDQPTARPSISIRSSLLLRLCPFKEGV